MPRLTGSDYLRQRKLVVELWEQEHIVWAELEPIEQWALHDYYVPSKPLSDPEALEHRRAMSKSQSSLASRAGKAYARLTSYHAAYVPRPQPRPPKRPLPKQKRRRRPSTEYVVRASAVVRPDPDWHKLARVLLTIAKENANKKDS